MGEVVTMRWRCVKAEPPTNSAAELLVFDEALDDVTTAFYFNDAWHFAEYEELRRVTHWMPLPTKEKKSDSFSS